MIINGTELLKAEPILNMETCKIESQGVSYGLGEAGYDIRIKQGIRFREGNVETFGITLADRLSFKLGRFTLASAVEKFNMPDHLCGVVHDKSTWARQGLSVFNTVIEPGFKGYLTLELVYHGEGELIIPAGAGIAQVLFHAVSEPRQYTGKYQSQPNRPVSAIMKK